MYRFSHILTITRPAPTSCPLLFDFVQSEDKEKATVKKKAETGSGLAREVDLKRRQRATTRLDSVLRL